MRLKKVKASYEARKVMAVGALCKRFCASRWTIQLCSVSHYNHG